MRHCAGTLGVVITAAMCVSGSARAQSIRLNVPQGFSAAKYATETSAWLYVGHPIGSTLLVLGTVQNPRTGYQELAVGLGVEVSGLSVEAETGLLLVEAPDGIYVEFYLAPTYSWGSGRISGAIDLYLPLGSTGLPQGYVDPLIVRTRLTGVVSLGVNAVWRSPLHASARLGIGPALEFSPEGLDVTIELLRGVVSYPHEARLGVSVLF